MRRGAALRMFFMMMPPSGVPLQIRHKAIRSPGALALVDRCSGLPEPEFAERLIGIRPVEAVKNLAVRFYLDPAAVHVDIQNPVISGSHADRLLRRNRRGSASENP